jgi:hypothetical protein
MMMWSNLLFRWEGVSEGGREVEECMTYVFKYDLD